MLDPNASYKIIWFYQYREKETIATGLDLFDAREHCNNDETSSATAKGTEALDRTARFGPWFDGFEAE